MTFQDLPIGVLFSLVSRVDGKVSPIVRVKLDDQRGQVVRLRGHKPYIVTPSTLVAPLDPHGSGIEGKDRRASQARIYQQFIMEGQK